MMARRHRKSSFLNQKRAERKLGKVHWVYCEGQTEAQCLEGLRKHFRLPTLKVRVFGEGDVPWTLVEKAKQKQRELRRKPGGSCVYVVFDRDTHPRFNEAIARARALGIEVGVSVPCFELWGILLHQNYGASLPTKKAQSLLKELHPGYHHRTNPYLKVDLVLAGMDKARSRANILKRRAAQSDDEFLNPTTTLSDVIDGIFGLCPEKSSP